MEAVTEWSVVWGHEAIKRITSIEGEVVQMTGETVTRRDFHKSDRERLAAGMSVSVLDTLEQSDIGQRRRVRELRLND